MRRTLRERLLSRAIINPDTGCWEWSGHKDRKGYGRIWRDGRNGRVHVAAYELTHGPVPEGLVLDHLCRNRACLNPAHCEPVTHRVNILRGEGTAAINARKTHCNAGHEFDLINTYFFPDGRRRCRTCERERQRAQKRNQPVRMDEAA